jgi:putative membrane protein
MYTRTLTYRQVEANVHDAAPSPAPTPDVDDVYSFTEKPFMRITRLAVAALVAALPMTAHAQAGGGKLNDAAIVGIFDAANTWDISTGTLASKKATRQDVKDFGKQLAGDHKTVQQQGRDLAKKLGVKPTPVAKDFALKKDFDDTMKKLNGLKGPAFDKAFLEHEVAYHKALIDAVTTQFLPAIQNAELKAFVEKVAPAFQGHMAMAENLLKK